MIKTSTFEWTEAIAHSVVNVLHGLINSDRVLDKITQHVNTQILEPNKKKAENLSMIMHATRKRGTKPLILAEAHQKSNGVMASSENPLRTAGLFLKGTR